MRAAREAGFTLKDSDALRGAWESFIDAAEPSRPDLFHLGCRLTGNAFDAEDLVHDGLLRAFGSLTLARGEVRNLRAYLFRVITNLWIDEQRRSRPIPAEISSTPDPRAPDPANGPALRDAAETLFGALPPRERVAVVLKDAFDLSHEQIAELLGSTPGAVRVALSRGRSRLQSRVGARDRPPRVSRALVERFVEAFRSHDIDALKSLLLEHVDARVFPAGVSVGREVNADRGWLHGCLFHHIPAREAERRPYPLGLRVAEVEGDPVVLVFRDYGDGTGAALEEVWRFEEAGGEIARIRDYCFSPDLVEWVAGRLGYPFRRLGYRFQPYRDTDVEEVSI